MKLYFKTMQDEGGLFFKNNKYNIIVRFAGKPKFIVEEYIKKYGAKKGKRLYSDFLDMIYNIEKSPFVLYLSDNLLNNVNNNKKNYKVKKRNISKERTFN